MVYEEEDKRLKSNLQALLQLHLFFLLGLGNCYQDSCWMVISVLDCFLWFYG